MYYKDLETKIINFIEDFGCVTEEQLYTLFNCDKNILKSITHNHFINRKGNIIVHKQKKIDKKVIAVIDILCEYKGRYKQFYKNFEPVYLSFFSKKGELYNIIVTEKADEKGIVKMLNNKTNRNWDADKLILLFEDEEMFDKIEIDIPYLYCTYLPVRIVEY